MIEHSYITNFPAKDICLGLGDPDIMSKGFLTMKASVSLINCAS